MIDALYISASGLRSGQQQIDVISNNVANMQTPGFKRGHVNFVDLATAAPPNTNQGSAGSGTRILSTSMSFAPGDLRATQNSLDLAIEGAGFFELEAEDGRLVYTRDGQFRLDPDGYLVSVRGLKLAHGFQIPSDAVDVRIAADGEVTARVAGEAEPSVMGRLELATFAVPEALASIGNNAYSATETAGGVAYGQPGDPGFGEVRQGYVEQANVDLNDEMSTLVVAQRAYQLNARLLQASDQILETINNLRR